MSARNEFEHRLMQRAAHDGDRKPDAYPVQLGFYLS